MEQNLKIAIVRLLNEEVIVTSWGITNINIKDTYIEFEVSGFRYQGKIKVTTTMYGYRINFDDSNYIDCTLDTLVENLDSIIEKTDNYEKDIFYWLVKK